MRPITPQRDGRDPACPHWCRRDHHPDDHVDDRLHQSGPAFVAVVRGGPRLGEGHPRADDVVLRLAQQVGSTTVWLEASSEEGRSLHLLLTAESAGRLAAAIADLLTHLVTDL